MTNSSSINPPTNPGRRIPSMPADGGDYFPSPPPFPFNFHLLEVTLISAQDLFPTSTPMRTYAVTWVRADRRRRTRLDAAGHTDPTWNDKFVFRVDDATLRSLTSAVHVDIYAARSRFLPGAGELVGTARAVLSTLRPAPATRFVALQVRRPISLRPQGILNMGVALIDAYARSLPIYADLGAPSFVFHGKNPNLSTIPPFLGALEGLEKKRGKKWRSGISEMEEIGGLEGSVKRGKLRWVRAMSCFNIAEEFAVEIAGDDGGATGRRCDRVSSSLTPGN